MPTVATVNGKVPKTSTEGAKTPATGHTIATVPSQAIARKYIGRKVAGVQDFDILKTAMDNGLNVLLSGPTGPGKTTVVQAFAAKNGLAFVSVPCSVGLDPSQLFGKYIPNPNKRRDADPEYIWVDGPVTDIFRHGGVLLIDEINFMPEKISTVLFSAFDKRREITLLDHMGETIRAHTDVLIVGAMNPEYQGTRPLNAAFRNRFNVQLYWDYDPTVEAKLVASKALRDVAHKLRNDASLQYGTPVSTNMLMEFGTHVELFDLKFAAEVFIQHFDASNEQQTVRGVIDTAMDNLIEDFRPPAEIEQANAGFNWINDTYLDPDGN